MRLLYTVKKMLKITCALGTARTFGLAHDFVSVIVNRSSDVYALDFSVCHESG